MIFSKLYNCTPRDGREVTCKNNFKMASIGVQSLVFGLAGINCDILDTIYQLLSTLQLGVEGGDRQR